MKKSPGIGPGSRNRPPVASENCRKGKDSSRRDCWELSSLETLCPVRPGRVLGVLDLGFFSFLYLKKIKILKIYGGFEKFQNYTPVTPCLDDRT